MIKYATIILKLQNVTDAGITVRSGDVTTATNAKNKQGKYISFTLKKDVDSELNSFLYENELFMVESREENQFECVAIEFVSLK